MRILILLALAFLGSFPASSFAKNNYKVWGSYKELDYLVEGVRENSVGLTKENLERTLKLRLMKNGIKPITAILSFQYNRNVQTYQRSAIGKVENNTRIFNRFLNFRYTNHEQLACGT